MKRAAFHKTIRFRRLTRKVYAVFSSLGCCVTIGTLKQTTADASLKKQKVGISVNPSKTDKNLPCNDESDDDLLYGLRLLELAGQLPLAGGTGCPEYHRTDNKPDTYSRKDRHTVFPAFSFYKTQI
jgi:hypothetical protein